MASPTNNTGHFNKWAIFGFTTTPEERIGPDPPYTYPALQVNLFFRVFLGIVSLLITWIPGRLLYRNGEFAGMVLCALTMILNFFTIINALIWRNDDVANWWAGYGWCDLQTYILFPIHTAFNNSLFEVMRGLAAKCAIDRVTSLTSGERKRQRIISAFVIFIVPFIQLILTYPLAVGRYNISTLVGCSIFYIPNWLFLIFFILPTPIFIIGAAIMAGLTFYRYRSIEKSTRRIILSQDSVAAARQARVRKKLYFTTLSCIVIVLPLILTLFVRNVKAGSPWNRPFDFDSFHFGPDPFNSEFISFTTSDLMTFQQLAINYIPEIAGLVLFIPFGTVVEALNAYRKLLVFLGLGHFFPNLHNEIKYEPRNRGFSPSWWSSFLRPLRSATSNTTQSSSRKASILPTVEHASLSSSGRNLPSFSSSSSNSHSPPTTNENPWPDLSAQEIDTYSAQLLPRSAAAPEPAPPPTVTRPPFVITVFRHAATVPRFPSVTVAIPFFRRRHHQHNRHHQEQQQQQQQQQSVGMVDTRVWATTNATASATNNHAHEKYDGEWERNKNNNKNKNKKDTTTGRERNNTGVVRVETRINTTTTTTRSTATTSTSTNNEDEEQEKENEKQKEEWNDGNGNDQREAAS